MSARGQELIDGRAFLDACEAQWLVTLVAFDDAASYELDGHTSCVAWLVDRCGLGKSTAKEKVRVAHELDRRPVIRDAFLAGVLTYSKARILTRLIGLNDDRDAAMVAEFADVSAEMMERMVRWWNLRNSDEPKEPDAYDQARVRFQPGFGGANGRIIIDGPNDDLARIMNLVDAYGTFLHFNTKQNEAPMEPPTGGVAPMEPAVLRADNPTEPARTISEALGLDDTSGGGGFVEVWDPAADEAPMEPPRSLNQRRYDWFLDLLEEVAFTKPDKVDPNRAAVGVTVPYESLTEQMGVGVLDAGTIVTGEALRRLCCDADISRIVVKGASEVLDLGRSTRTWNRAQRRAARFRFNNCCAVRGCDRRITEIHHIVFWRNGGKTCIQNAIPLCSRHHHMVHEGGWTIQSDLQTGTTTFQGPRGHSLTSETDPFLVHPPTLAAA